MFESCAKVTEWMSGFDRPWGIAGGWAIDLFIGKETRVHSDIEVAIYREDQFNLKEAFPDWHFEKAVDGKLLPWGQEWLELPIHEIHGMEKSVEIRLEVLLNEAEDEKWIFRRDPRISFPKTKLFRHSINGTPYLHPVLVLLYKAKNTRDKDYVDFSSALEYLNAEDKRWLKAALQVHMPDHQWVSEL